MAAHTYKLRPSGSGLVMVGLLLSLTSYSSSYKVMEMGMSPSDPMGAARHMCDRVCDEREDPMICHYTFTIELFTTLGRACFDCPYNVTDCFRPHCISADGTKRGIVSINRMMPGEPVVVCQGDQVVVDVVNMLSNEVTSVHFHGEHFRGQQFMDGTPYITQCPILPHNKFRYSFVAKVAGTNFHHAHTAFQREDGHFGPYIVRQPPSQEPHNSLYDYDLTEHIIFPQEWFHYSAREAFLLHHWDTGSNKPNTYLINGRGRLHDLPIRFRPGQKPIYPNETTIMRTPLATFSVTSGNRYRFRVINPGFALSPVMISVDDHELLIVASDGNPVVPQKVKSFVIHNGERYDFVLNANQKAGTYWIRFGGQLDAMLVKAHAAAVLVYDHVMPQEEAAMLDIGDHNPYETFVNISGLQLNAINYAPVGLGSEINRSKMSSAELRSLPKASKTMSKALREKPDKTFYFGYDFYGRNNPSFHHPVLYSYGQVQTPRSTPMINNISMVPPSEPLLSQGGGPDLHVCNEFTLKDSNCDSNKGYCECTHMVEVDIGDVVEMWFIDEGFAFDVSHPFHVHGTEFYVVAMERHAKNSSHTGPVAFEGNFILRDTVIEMNEAGRVKKNLVDPPIKDTVTVPDAGFTVIRFLADNMGYWLTHCHMSWHNHIGMAFVIKVGDVERNMPKPPAGFPRCGDFTNSCSVK